MKTGSVVLLSIATACLVLLLQSRGTHARAFDLNMLDEREAEAGMEKRDAALRNTIKSLIMSKNNEDRLFEPNLVEQKRGGSKSIDYAEDMVKFALWCRQMNLAC